MTCSRLKAVLVLLLASSAFCYGQGTPASSDPVMRAMVDELERSVAELQFKDLEKPYFIQYVILDQEEYRASATFGALTASDRDRARILQAQVRVGDYEFDNSEFISGQGFQGPPPSGITSSTIIDNDYDGIRHALWLATDAAYKQAVEQLARKRAFVQNKTRSDQIPDFSKEKPVTVVAPRQGLELDSGYWEKRLREWSAIFKEFPAVQQSTVGMDAQLIHRYLVNSEGTRTLQPSMIVSVEAAASSEGPDGMRLRHLIPFYARSFDQLPSAGEIGNSIRRMASDLTALRSAPVLDADYSGPVLFTGQASAEPGPAGHVSPAGHHLQHPGLAADRDDDHILPQPAHDHHANRGSAAAGHDALDGVHAADVPVLLPEHAGWAGALLANQQRVQHVPAVLHGRTGATRR